jgi:hypothetical protein
MTVSVSDFIIERLGQWNIRRLFGYPGDGIGSVRQMIGKIRTAGSHQRPSSTGSYWLVVNPSPLLSLPVRRNLSIRFIRDR